MITFDAIELHHLIDLHPRLRGDICDLDLNDFVEHATRMSRAGVSYACVNEKGITIAIGGVLPIHRGTGQVWIVGCEYMRKHIKEFTRSVKELKVLAMDSLNLHRLQAEVLVSKPSWVRWAKAFGLKEEGVMRQWTHNKEDVVMLGYVRGDE